MSIKIDLIVGARPNFMKIAPIHRAMLRSENDFEIRLIHTGQHYDQNMSKIFFEELELPKPDYYLNVGSGTHGAQTAAIMIKYEELLLKEETDILLVVGDVNSTLACALVAVKLGIPIAHIEAGLRSYDMEMPEEINRILTDRISDLLFTSCADANVNLSKEGISEDKIYFVGNVMIDSLHYYMPKAMNSDILNTLDLKEFSYAVLTMHRPSNVNKSDTFINLIKSILEVSKKIPVIFPIHPRTKNMIEQIQESLGSNGNTNLITIDPIGYFDFLKLQKSSKFILTDSGGIQEESTVLGIPCLTLRENTERPVTVSEGTSILVGSDPNTIIGESNLILEGKGKKGSIPDKWEGNSSEEIVSILSDIFG